MLTISSAGCVVAAAVIMSITALVTMTLEDE